MDTYEIVKIALGTEGKGKALQIWQLCQHHQRTSVVHLWSPQQPSGIAAQVNSAESIN